MAAYEDLVAQSNAVLTPHLNTARKVHEDRKAELINQLQGEE